MKLLWIICWLCLGVVTHAQDTLFIKRTVADTPYAFYHAIFIDTSSTSVFRNRVTQYEFDRFDSTVYFEGLACLERPRQPRKFTTTQALPRNWIPLFQYKGKFYLYHASDGCCIFRFRITDTTTMDHTMEGPSPSWIKRINYQGKGKFLIERTSQYNGSTVSVHIIDPQRGIAILNFSSSKYSQGQQLLMVDADRAHLFPMIVNYCITERMEELEFEPIDFARLQKSSKRSNRE